MSDLLQERRTAEIIARRCRATVRSSQRACVICALVCVIASSAAVICAESPAPILASVPGLLALVTCAATIYWVENVRHWRQRLDYWRARVDATVLELGDGVDFAWDGTKWNGRRIR